MIKIDMEMPKNCYDCELEKIANMGTSYACSITGNRTMGIREAMREVHCPLYPITEWPPKVGDEVFYPENPEYTLIVTWTDGKAFGGIACQSGRAFEDRNVDEIQMTGRHFEDVKSLLEKLKEMSDEL